MEYYDDSNVHHCNQDYFEKQKQQQNYIHYEKGTQGRIDIKHLIITEQCTDFATNLIQFKIHRLSPFQFTKDTETGTYYLPFQGDDREKTTKYTFVLGKGISNEEENKYDDMLDDDEETRDNWGNEDEYPNKILVKSNIYRFNCKVVTKTIYK